MSPFKTKSPLVRNGSGTLTAEATRIVAPFNAGVKLISFGPAVRFATVSASRSEMPSEPGLAINASQLVTLPLIASEVVVTTIFLRVASGVGPYAGLNVAGCGAWPSSV